MEFPLVVTIRQELVEAPLPDPARALDDGLERADFERTFRGARRVAVAVGSRGIDGAVGVTARLVASLKDLGCEPFLVPAMGSHGGATAEGQAAVLYDRGYTEDAVGAPVVSSMAVERLGKTGRGTDVFMDRSAAQSDAVVVVNRVAPHTGFSGPVQSGVVKMLAAGLGKREGARALHGKGFEDAAVIGEVADVVIREGPPIMAVALVEDGHHRLSILEVLRGDEIREREPALLERALAMYPAIPFGHADVLVVDEIGKDISGVGMDPMVTGRGKSFPQGEEPRFTADRLVALSLTGGSGGNATGIGHADITTERLVKAMDRAVTYRNVLTSGALYRARVPLTAASDAEAVSMAIESTGKPPGELRLVRIRNTAKLEEMTVSVALADELRGNRGITFTGDPRPMEFDRWGGII